MQLDPFRDRTQDLNAGVNPYLRILQTEHDLPLLHGACLRHAASCWRSYFATRGLTKPQALLVEIGCYRGRNLLEMAQRYPQSAFIGIDLTFKRVVLTAQAIHAQGLPNAVSVLSDARDLAALFHADELDGVVCFFPDPWAKPRQRKKRLLSASYCEKLAILVKSGGFVWLKTDDGDYFAQAVQALLRCQFCLTEIVPLELLSVFEQRFCVEGRKIYYGVLINGKEMPMRRELHPLLMTAS